MSESRALQVYGILQNRRIFPFEKVQEAFEFKKQYPELFEWAKEQNEKPQLAPQQVVTPDEAVAQQPVPRNPSNSWMKWVSRSETTTVIETHPDGSTVERRRVVQGPSLELQGEACNQATRSLCGAILQEAATGLGFLTSGVGGVLRIAFGAAAAPAPLQIEDAGSSSVKRTAALPRIEDDLPSSGKRNAEDELQNAQSKRLKEAKAKHEELQAEWVEAQNEALSAKINAEKKKEALSAKINAEKKKVEEARLEATNAAPQAELAELAKANDPLFEEEELQDEEEVKARLGEEEDARLITAANARASAEKNARLHAEKEQQSLEQKNKELVMRLKVFETMRKAPLKPS